VDHRADTTSDRDLTGCTRAVRLATARPAFGFIGEAFGAPASFTFLAFTSIMASCLVGFCVTETVKKRELAPAPA
jgi:hypothetical protein